VNDRPVATRDSFLAFAKRKVAKYFVPALGEDVYLQTLTQGELMDCGSGDDQFAKMVAYSLVDQDGDQLFHPRSPTDVEFIRGWQSGIASELAVLIRRHCGLDKDEQDILGNSE
jgi:hypothetical protein